MTVRMAVKKAGLEKVPVIIKKFDSRDEEIGRQLNKSARQVCKMREISKKADASLLEKIQNGSVSINIEPIKSLTSQLCEPINLIFEPIYLMILIYLSR